MATETRWDGDSRHALERGVGRSLSLPLGAEDVTVGALNTYAANAHAFDAPAVLAVARGLAGQAGTLLTVVLRQAREAELTGQLRAALDSRAVIDQALGEVMGQRRCTAAEAFAQLRALSQRSNRKLRDVAAEVVTAVSGGQPASTPFRGPG